MPKYWIQTVVRNKNKGALHRQLGIPEKQRIPRALIETIVSSETGKVIKNPTKTGRKRIKVTRLLKRRSLFALNVGYGRFKRKR